MRENNVSHLLNSGIIPINCDDLSASPEEDAAPRTIIITGVARGGTTMVAKLLAQMGLFLGDQRSGIVLEDVDIARSLQARDQDALRAVISDRNARHRSWGFKRPHLHEWLQPNDLSLFRHPRLVVILRDPVAVAQRNILSMHSAVQGELRLAVASLDGLIAFALQLPIPVLLVSYEKALMKPDAFILRLARFCGVPLAEGALPSLHAAIAPEDEHYLQSSQLRIEGRIAGIVDGRLTGWGRILHDNTPLPCELLVDSRPVHSFHADQHHAGQDGDQNCGFSVDLNNFDLTASSIITIRMAGRSLHLDGSGQTVRMLCTDDSVKRLLARATPVCDDRAARHRPSLPRRTMATVVTHWRARRRHRAGSPSRPA